MLYMYKAIVRHRPRYKFAIGPYFQPDTFNIYWAHFNVMLFYTFYPNYFFKDNFSLFFFFFDLCFCMPHSYISS